MIETVSDLFKGGKPDAVDLLTNDHRVVDSLFAKVKANETAISAVSKIKSEMDVHAHIAKRCVSIFRTRQRTCSNRRRVLKTPSGKMFLKSCGLGSRKVQSQLKV